jgi:hypothetical protein
MISMREEHLFSPSLTTRRTLQQTLSSVIPKSSRESIRKCKRKARDYAMRSPGCRGK